MGFKESFFGDGERYDYGAMCRMTHPWKKNRQPINFYSRDEKIPWAMATLMGLQHAFSMVGGLITVPFVIFRFSVDFGNSELQQYAIGAALIASGICSLINVSKFQIPFSQAIFGRPMFLGSGVLSVMGTSFTFLPIYEIAIAQMKAEGISGIEAYGRMLGTSMVCGLLEMAFSFMPLHWITFIFPPIVTAITVMLIGVSLVGTGMKYWGGGTVCAEMIWQMHDLVADQSFPPPSPVCLNGEVALGYGSPEFIGLGFSVMVFLVIIELFGSVFMKNCNVILALLFGYLIAGLSRHDGAKYVDTSKIADARTFTFFWVETFPIGFYGPAVIPLLIAYLVTTVETIGDISAVYEVSELDTNTLEYKQSLQGGLTSDSVCSLLSNLFTSMPNTTFSQNNGVIALTKCASRRAGYACGCWLIFLGVFSKISGVITSIPDSVIGGMTIFLFANVLVSGISLAATLELHSRRIKFIMALSLAIGVGVTVWPFAFQDLRASSYTANFWRCDDCSKTLQGVRNGVSILLSTGYCVGTIVAMLLNFILPADAGVLMPGDTAASLAATKQLDVKELSDGTPEKEDSVADGAEEELVA